MKRFSGISIFSIATQNRQPPNFGELEKKSGETVFSGFFSVKELDHIFHFRYFRAPTDVCGAKGVTLNSITPLLSFFSNNRLQMQKSIIFYECFF